MKRRNFMVCLFCTLTISPASNQAAADSFGSGANSFDIQFVTIGDPGNAADTTGNPNPAGAVPYTYRMGKFEISDQMVDTLAAVPEPSALLLLRFGSLAVFWRRRGLRSFSRNELENPLARSDGPQSALR